MYFERKENFSLSNISKMVRDIVGLKPTTSRFQADCFSSCASVDLSHIRRGEQELNKHPVLVSRIKIFK